MDKKHADELKALAQKGLIKMSIRGIGKHENVMIVHKNVPNKISRDFIEREQEVVTFIDRNEDKPAKCHLYKSSFLTKLIYVHPDELAEELKNENDDLTNCAEMIFKKES